MKKWSRTWPRFTEQRQSTAEVVLGLVQIVRAAAQFEILDSRRTASSVGPDVVKLKKASFRAAALGADERAPAAVPFPYCSPDERWNVSRPQRFRARGAWALDSRKFGPLEIGKEQRHGSIDDLSQISSRNGVTQQILRSTELVVRGASHGQLDLVAVGRERRQRNMS